MLRTLTPLLLAAAHALAADDAADAGPAAAVILGFVGRRDAEQEAYGELLGQIQKTGEEKHLEILYPSGQFRSFEDMESEVQRLKTERPGAAVVYMGHGMGEQGGASLAQHYAANASAAPHAVVLLAGFLERHWRPEVLKCAETWRIQPTVRCPKGLCPGGYLKDGVHNCSGPPVPMPHYPLPTLSIGGELDGVVRITRMAEAWYTQQPLPQHQVKPVLGMNHGDLMTSVPGAVAQRDLVSELGAAKARSQVAELIVDFLLGEPQRDAAGLEEEFFKPFVEVFVKQEGSWWWTSNSDEAGSSSWAAAAQQRLVQPLPESCAAAPWRARNEFHMLSDEELIPPYYRTKHRPNITRSSPSSPVDSVTMTQLRYVELSVLQAAAGLNGWQVIKEEKAGVLADRGSALASDDGEDFVSAMEIATKLASRELAFKVCGEASGPKVDDGDRCKAINQAAYDLALSLAGSAALRRFRSSGRPLVMAPDRKPTPPAGPWWIWNYLSFLEKEDEVEVASWYAFYPLSGPAYGAGNHYCKLLSPARALEWIYIDGLRRGRNATAKTVMV